MDASKDELKEALLDDASDVSDAPPATARAALVRGRRPDDVADLRRVLPPLPDDTRPYVSALVPAYNEEASDVVLTLADLYWQEKELLGGRRVVACLVLDGLDRKTGDSRQPILSASTRRFLETAFPGTEEAWAAFEKDDEEANLLLVKERGGRLAPVAFAEGMALQLVVTAAGA